MQRLYDRHTLRPKPSNDRRRQLVRDVVQEELRGDLGREIIEAMKKEVLLTLADKT